MIEKAHQISETRELLPDWSLRIDSEADNALLRMVYHELRRQAHRYLQKERTGHTLQTTALVHEAYLRLTEQRSPIWESRSHFLGLAATMMRRILIDYAKSKHRLRRGSGNNDLPLETAVTVAVSDINFDLIELDEALDRLAEKDKNLTRVVELRFFSGLNVPETAAALGVSESTVKRDWALAKAWLHRELTK